MLRITIKGLDDVKKQIGRLERGAAAMARTEAVVGSGMPYAYGAERGRHRVSGKLARRSGGRYYLLSSVQRMQSEADADISAGLKKVTAPGPWVLKRLGLWVRRLARARAPRGAVGGKAKPYRLYKSIRYYTRRR